MPLPCRPVRSRGLWQLGLAGLCLTALSNCTPASSSLREIEGYVLDSVAVQRWDTVLEIRSPANDTTLLLPTQVVAWDGGVVVADEIANHLSYFNLDGSLEWTVGRTGEGPNEFRAIIEMFVGPDSALWVLDSSNRRVSKISRSGVVLDTQPLVGIPIFPWGLLPLGDSLLILANHRQQTFSMVSADNFALLSTRGLVWPDGLPDRASVSLRGAAHPDGQRWAAGLQLGPGFVIGSRDGFAAHDFAEPVPFAVAPATERAVFGSTAAHATADGIFFLFGGRPVRIADMEGDPPKRIDQYSWDGEFVRRFLLPSGITDFFTDGNIFYLVQEVPEPAILVLEVVPRW